LPDHQAGRWGLLGQIGAGFLPGVQSVEVLVGAHRGIEQLLALVTLDRDAKRSELAVERIETGSGVAAVVIAVRDGERLVDEIRLSGGISLVAGGQIAGDLAGSVDELVVLGHAIFIQVLGGQLRPVVGAVIERIGVGVRVGVVRTPVALHEGVLAAAANLGQEAGRRAGLDDDVDQVLAEEAFELLLHDHALLSPGAGGRVVRHEHLDREGRAGSLELGDGLIHVLLGERLVEGIGAQLGDRGERAHLGVVQTVDGDELRRGHGVKENALGIVRLHDELGLHAVKAIVERLAEVLVVDDDLPVLRLVLGVEIRIEVEEHPVGIEAALADRADQISGLLAGEPLGSDRAGDGRAVHLALAEELRRQGAGFLVVGLLDGRDEHVLGVPVGLVLGVDALLLGLEDGQGVRAVVEDVLVAGGNAELRALLSEEVRIHRHEAHVGDHAQEVRAGLDEGILQGVVVKRLHADSLKVHHRVGLGALFRGAGAQVVILGAGDDGIEDVSGRRSVRRVKDVLGGGDEVVRGHVGIDGAVGLDPLRAFANLEGVGQARLVILPALSQGWLHLAVLVVLDQGVDDVGGDRELVGGRSGQVIQAGDFRGIQRTISAIGKRAGHAKAERQAQRKSDDLLHGCSSLKNIVSRL